MKKAILILLTIGLLSLTTGNEKVYRLSEGEAIITYQLVETFQKLASKSDDVTTKQFGEINKACDSIKKVIGVQYQMLNDTTKNKAK